MSNRAPPIFYFGYPFPISRRKNDWSVNKAFIILKEIRYVLLFMPVKFGARVRAEFQESRKTVYFNCCKRRLKDDEEKRIRACVAKDLPSAVPKLGVFYFIIGCWVSFKILSIKDLKYESNQRKNVVASTPRIF